MKLKYRSLKQRNREAEIESTQKSDTSTFYKIQQVYGNRFIDIFFIA